MLCCVGKVTEVGVYHGSVLWVCVVLCVVTEVGVYHGLTVKYNNSFSKKKPKQKTERNKSIVESQLVVQPVVFVSKKHF